MNILALETSSKHFSLAVARDGKILCSRNTMLKDVLSDSILPAIEGILKKSKLTLSGLDGFAIGLGPGSFTSLRVGVATVKGFAFATGKPVVGIPSLDVLAMNAPGDGLVCSLCDAKRNMVYACLYEKKGNILKRKSKYLLTEIPNVLKLIKGECVFVGDGVPLFKEAIEKAVKIAPKFLDDKLLFPQARNLATLAFKRFESKKYDESQSLVPLYLYPMDCQVVKR